MLVLTRKSEQKILIGDEVEITILKVQGDQVSIGIQAPKNVRIFRKELLDEGCKDKLAKPSAPKPAKEKPFASYKTKAPKRVARFAPQSEPAIQEV